MGDTSHRKAGQDALFPEWQDPQPAANDSPLVALPAIDATTSLAGLALPYRNYLLLQDHTAHTVDCFLSDLRLLSRFLGTDTVVGTVRREHIVNWLMNLRWGSDERPAPKTMARRVTFLKNFFGWLTQEGVIAENIATKVAFTRPLPPLPDLLFEDEMERLMVAAAADARCHLLVMLALDGGLKKEEMLALTTERVDLSDPTQPRIAVRLPGQSRPQRERMIALPAGFTAAYERYLRHYRPQGALYDCTDRNLTYILARAVKHAGITKRVTLQLLRDCFAVRQLRAGVSLTELREKLGLSDEAWYESQEKYRKLAFPV
jgi:site-specific recombinase XerD